MATITDFQNRNVRIGNGAGQGSPSNPWAKPKKISMFPTESKRSSLIRSTVQSYHDLFDDIGIDDDNFYAIFNSFDDAADDILRDILSGDKLTADQFVMSSDSVEALLDFINTIAEDSDFHAADDDIQEWPLSINYEAADEDDTQYTLMLHHVLKHNVKTDQDNIDSDGCLMRIDRHGELNLFSCDTHEWFECPPLANIMQFSESSPAARNFLDVIEYFTDLPLFLMDVEELWDFMCEQKPLIDLADKLNGLGDFRMLLPWDPVSKDHSTDDGKMILVADDDHRVGTAVYYENGVFYLCQLNIDGYEDETLMFYDVSIDDVGYHFKHVAAKTNSSKTVYRLLNDMWDHYNRDIYWFTAPLSAYTYVSADVNKPENLKPVFLKNSENLTANEKKNLSFARKMMKEELEYQAEIDAAINEMSQLSEDDFDEAPED